MTSTPIDELDTFAYEPGEWRSWDASQWNRELLLFCFLRDHSRHAAAPIRASLNDLPELVKEPQANPEELVQALLAALRWQARQHNLDPVAYAIHRGQVAQRSGNQLPDYFAFLWITCLVAHGYPDPSLAGHWHSRFSGLFPRADRRLLVGLPALWDLLAQWLNAGRSVEGHSFTGLQLPPVDPHRSNISHSWRLAFPQLLDRRRLSRVLHQLAGSGQPLHPQSPALLQALEQEPFSISFLAELQAYRLQLERQPDQTSWFAQVLERELQHLQPQPAQPDPPADCAAAPAPSAQSSSAVQHWGPLLLEPIDHGLGLLCLHQPDLDLPEGLGWLDEHSPLPGQIVLTDLLSDNPGLEPFDAGSLMLDSGFCPLPQLQPALERGLLVFALDPSLERPRLLLQPSEVHPPTHVFVHVTKLAAFQACFDAEATASDEEDWRCFRDIEASPAELFAFPAAAPQDQARHPRPRISPYGGLRLSQGQGFLASGLGLPDVRIHGPEPALQVLVVGPSGGVAEYTPCAGSTIGSEATTPQQWQPIAQVRQRQHFACGEGRIVAFFAGASTLEQRLPLTRMQAAPRFARQRPLICREDWGLELGPICLARQPAPEPDANAMAQARELLNQRSGGVNPWIEEQILDGLCAAFERRESISSFDAIQLFRQLGGRSSHWPLFEQGMLRGWCEGGWLEEGIEARRGHWRLQPVDPRLVQVADDRVQLVGLLSAQGLIELVAHALALELQVLPVAPSCPEMPRGWRFEGAVERLAARCGLPLVALEDWNGVQPRYPWEVRSMPCDGDDLWPRSAATSLPPSKDPIVGNRQGCHRQWSLDPSEQPQPGLAIQRERNRYGRYRWHSRSPEDGRVYTSCHRNRVALNQLAEASGGLWPFGQPERFSPVIERLCDADAYLPLPLGRMAALCGAAMPGPTLPASRAQHTYRYSFDQATLEVIREYRTVPLTTPRPG